MTPQMKALIQRVEREMTINQSVATLNTGIAAQIQTGNRVSLHALVESLREDHVAVARAILANTKVVPSAEPESPIRTLARVGQT